ncbi:MAG: cell division protein FtsZ, partial [Chloroflexi bacterium]|nr:cell division protein FtsZ [Chloroflexota bacterium]
MAVNSREPDGIANIKVIGVGGGGSNAVSRMFRERVPTVEYMVVNTDAQALVRCDVPLKIRIGDQLTSGKGVGGNPDLGMRSAEESREELYEAVRDADMIFVAAG